MLNKECGSILQNKIPPKLNDPGSFTKLYTMGNSHFEKAHVTLVLALI